MVDRAKTGEESEEYSARCVERNAGDTVRRHSHGLFYKIESGFEYGNAWDIVARLNALANTRPMHWLEEEGKIFDVCESELPKEISQRE